MLQESCRLHVIQITFWSKLVKNRVKVRQEVGVAGGDRLPGMGRRAIPQKFQLASATKGLVPATSTGTREIIVSVRATLLRTVCHGRSQPRPATFASDGSANVHECALTRPRSRGISRRRVPHQTRCFHPSRGHKMDACFAEMTIARRRASNA